MIAVSSILIIDDIHYVRLRLLTLIRQQFPNIPVNAISKSDTDQFFRCHSDVHLILCDPAEARPQLAFYEFKSLQGQAPNVPILLHCGCNHFDFDLLACISSGGRGFLSKAAPLSEYILAISTVMEGRTYLARDVKLWLIENLKLRTTGSLPPPGGSLISI